MCNISFLGCKPVYTKNGYIITPIAKDPSDAEITRTMDAAEDFSKYVNSGIHASVYSLGKDLVVKKYQCTTRAQDEISALDNMYDNDIKSSGIQSGMYAFTTPKGVCYLVSKKISGEPIKRVKFNKENLSCIVDALLQLDKPRLENNKYGVYINYDMHDENILASENSAGIIDYEYLKFISLDESMSVFNKGRHDIRTSDIPGCSSNLRTFEIGILYRYLNRDYISKSEREILFYIYLLLKSEYHQKMSDYLQNEYERSKNEYLKELAIKHKAHAQMLKNPDKNVINAEYLKMEIGNTLSEYAGISHELANKAYYFVSLQYLMAQNSIQNIYWADCKKYIESACKMTYSDIIEKISSEIKKNKNPKY